MRNTRQFCQTGRIPKILSDYASPSTEHLKCLKERQFQSITPLLSTTGKCRYGFPQVTVNPPVNIENKMAFSGMIRLTCPHLVKEIDSLERDGGVAQFNEEIAPTTHAIEDFLEAHQVWNDIRLEAMSIEEVEYIHQRFGEKAENFFATGFLGIQMGKTDDVKCLHAHTADELLRGRNSIGKAVFEKLKSRAVDPSGCQDCWQQCDLSVNPEEAKWWYTSEKSRSKLIKKKENRKRHREYQHRKKNRQDDDKMKVHVLCDHERSSE